MSTHVFVLRAQIPSYGLLNFRKQGCTSLWGISLLHINPECKKKMEQPSKVMRQKVFSTHSHSLHSETKPNAKKAQRKCFQTCSPRKCFPHSTSYKLLRLCSRRFGRGTKKYECINKRRNEIQATAHPT